MSINILFKLSLEAGNDAVKSTYFYRYYMPWVEILVDNKLIFDQSIRNNQEAYEKLLPMRGNIDYTTRTIRLFSSSRCYKLIGIDLKRQTIPKVPQKVNLIVIRT